MDEKKNQPLMDSAEKLTGSRRPPKRRFPAVITICAAAAVCIGLLAALRMEARQPEETSAASPAMVRLASAAVTSIQVTLEQESYVVFNDDGSGYRIEGMDDFEVDAGKARRMVAQSTNLNAQGIVKENAEDMAQYGLSQPRAVVGIQTQDGESQVIHIGDPSPASGFYACIAGQNTVYTLATSVAEMLMLPLKDLHAVETPAIAEPYAPAYLRIEWPEETQKRGMRILEIQKQPRKDIGIGASNYLMTQPFAYDVDVAALAALVENIAGIKAESYVGEMEDETVFGMDRAVRITIRDAAGMEVRMAIGGNADENHQYLYFDDDKSIYLTTSATVSFLDEITLAGSVDRFISLVGIDKLERIVISAEKRTDVLRIDRQAEQTRYMINDVQLDDLAFKAFYQELCALTANGIAEQVEQLSDPEISITFELQDDVELRVEYIGMDRENYAVRRDGSIHVYVQKNKVARLLEKLYALE